MYAIIEIGGKQYKVEENSVIDVELQKGKPGDKIELKNLLLSADGEKISVGQPYVKGAKINARIVSHNRGPKLIAFTYRRRENYRRKKGHRQTLTRVKIDKIVS